MPNLILRIGLLSGICLVVGTQARAADEEKIKASVAKAIAFLRSHHSAAIGPGGAVTSPIPYSGDEGHAALSAIALLEAHVAYDDPVVQAIVARVRDTAIGQIRTYNLALELILLDKLGEEADTLLIQSIGARLIIGQTMAGGWGYECPPLEEGLKERLRKKLSGATMKGSNEPPQIGVDVNHRPRIDPDIEAMLERHRQASAGNTAAKDNRSDDNSNTQFAVIAIWSARRHGMPVEAVLKRVDRRFRETQINGGWTYIQAPNQVPTAPMTCAGLLGLAVSTGMRSERVLKSRGSLGPDGRVKMEPSKDAPPPLPNPLNDPAVRAGVNFLTLAINTSRNSDLNGPNGHAAQGMPIPMGGISGAIPPGGDLRQNLYFLWSLERVSVVFRLTHFGKHDWYEWGAEWLLSHQSAAGSWKSLHGEVADTAFGLMFLVHANIVRDLTHVLTANSDSEPGENRAAKGAGANKSKDGRADSSAEESESALARSLLKAGVAKQAALIKEYAEKQGSEYSLALAEAIPKLKDSVQEDARAALATRMSRLKASVIRDWLQYENAEIRRAAAIGAAIHHDAKSFIPDLITALDDEDEIVWRGAALALRTITKKDFGPRKGDSEADRQKAKADWDAWWKTQQ